MNKMLTLLTVGQYLLGQKDSMEKNVVHWSWYIVVSVVIICSSMLAYLIALDYTGQKMAIVIAGFAACVLYCVGYAVYRYIQYLKLKKLKQFATSTACEVYQQAVQFISSVDKSVIVKTVIGGIALVVFSKILKKIF